MRGFRSFLPLVGVATVLASAAPRRAPVTYEVYAIRYGSVKNFRLSSLISGVDTSRRLDLAMMVWLLKGSDGRNVLVDAGFYRDNFVRRWKPDPFETPAAAVARFGVKPEDVSDIIISHIHWDHVDGADLFPNARIWIQREEVSHHMDSTGKVLDNALSAVDAVMLDSLRRAGRLRLVDGDGQEIIAGITVYTGGKHTFASQYAAVHAPEGTIVVASDNAYLYENLETHRPIAQTLDSLSNLRAQARMLTLASDRRFIVPGHDPTVFERFPEPGQGVAWIH